jgi:cytochrome c peroxidase
LIQIPAAAFVAMRRCYYLFLLLSVNAVVALAQTNVHQHEPPTVLAPGYRPLEFTAPPVGSYQLPTLGKAGDGPVLDSDGSAVNLYELLDQRTVVMSLIFTSCADVNGCPLATYVLSRIQARVQAEPALAKQVRFVSLSFDPTHDTPEVMRNYGQAFRKPENDWRFVTTDSEETLAPLLAGYNQTIQKDFDAEGNFLGSFSHILRVFLIDADKNIRNIYSTSFLHADVVLNDIKTLQLDSSDTKAEPDQPAAIQTGHRGPGDVKSGYELESYQTSSKPLTARRGNPIDLYSIAAKTQLGLPALPVPVDNPITGEKILLGRQLFYDRRLSHNNTISCAMCHIPEQGFTSNELAMAIGIEGRTVRRNAPSLYNVAYVERLFHDAREHQLELQIWSPLLANNEMGNPAIGYLLEKLKRLPEYQQRFERVFGDSGINMETLGKALASYQRALVSANSPFDRWHFAGESGALNPSAKRGFGLFTGKAGCVACHRIDEAYALFTDQQLHNTGIGYARSMAKTPDRRRVQVAPGTFLMVDGDLFAHASEPVPNDLGHYEISGNPADRWKYKTPTLRNVALSPPYMHDGSLPTLKSVVGFYNNGGIANELRDPLIAPLGLSDSEMEDLVSLLRALTGDNVDALVTDAFAAPIGDPQPR